jgi:hypothetical protein
MCLLTFLPAEIQPDPQALSTGTLINDDGHGFAIVTPDELIIRRGMHAEQMIEAFTAARRARPHGPALFHSRFGTHGRTSLGNCHPFLVGGDARTVIAHNGVLPASVQPQRGDPRSDTRIAAEEYLPACGPLRLRRTRLRLQRWMGTDNKIVILTVDRRSTRRAYILNEDAGIWDDGIWYSNTGYRPPLRPEAVSARRWESGLLWGCEGGSAPQGEQCWYCGASTVDGYCPMCRWCADCEQSAEDCQCYAPAAGSIGWTTARHMLPAEQR